MKNEDYEALKQDLEEMVDVVGDVQRVPDEVLIAYDETVSEVLIIIERQVPESLINDKCWECGVDVRNWTGDDEFNFCPYCGKAIDWSTDED